MSALANPVSPQDPRRSLPRALLSTALTSDLQAPFAVLQIPLAGSFQTLQGYRNRLSAEIAIGVDRLLDLRLG